MKKLLPLVPLSLGLALAGCQNMEAIMPWVSMGNDMAKSAGYNTDEKLAAGIKEALVKGTDAAAAQLSQEGAMNLQLPPGRSTHRQYSAPVRHGQLCG